MINIDDIKIFNINLKTNYYLGDTEYNNYYLKVELLPEEKDQDTVILYFNNKILFFSETDESFRSDMWNKDLQGEIIYLEENSKLLNNLIENSSFLYEKDDLKHFVISTYNQIVDIVCLENPMIVLSNNNYNSEFDYEINYSSESKESNLYKDTFEKLYPKTSQILKDFKINPNIPFTLTDEGIDEELFKKEYSAYYAVKGNLLKDGLIMNVEGTELEFISMDREDIDFKLPFLEKPYFIVGIKNIKLGYK